MVLVTRLARSILAGSVLALAVAARAAAADDVKVVASGLDNPRGLNFGPGGDLYVAEAGKGGNAKCVAAGEGPGGQICFGTSGAVTRVEPDGDDQKRITTGLPSHAAPDGTGAIGPLDVSWPADGIKDLGFLTIGLADDPALKTEF